METRHRAVVVGPAVVGVLALWALVARRWYLRWGASDDEVSAALPGDDLLATADLVATRAITVAAAAGDVWPWLVQIGQGRGGFYSYDGLENLVGCDIHSAARVVPEWQHLAAGDEVRLAPDVALSVAIVEPEGALVLRGGASTGPAPVPYDFTWAFVLRPRPDGLTRLVVRERYAYVQRWAGLLVEPVEALSFVMSQRMLRGIRDRAERPTVKPA